MSATEAATVKEFLSGLEVTACGKVSGDPHHMDLHSFKSRVLRRLSCLRGKQPFLNKAISKVPASTQEEAVQNDQPLDLHGIQRSSSSKELLRAPHSPTDEARAFGKQAWFTKTGRSQSPER